jgi:hypothetical protein
MKMKRTPCFPLSILAALALLGGADRMLAQITPISLTFDTDASVVDWGLWWGKPTYLIEFDPAMDAGADPASGAMKITVDFDVVKYGGENQFCFLYNLPAAVDGTLYTTLSMDVYVDPSSPQRPWGDFGNLNFGLRHEDWGQQWITNQDLNPASSWIHFEGPVPGTGTDPSITNVAGIQFTMWSGDASWGQSGTYVFWVDNVKLVPKPVGTDIVNFFDTISEVSQWSHWWGKTATTLEFDPTVDAGNDANSGSMKITINWDLAANGGDNQFCFLRNVTPAVDGLLYTNMEMDILVDPASPQRPWGDFGNITYGIRHGDWTQAWFTNQNVPTNGGWFHTWGPVPVTDASITNVAGLAFTEWSGDAVWGQTGTMTMWVDNIRFVAKAANVPPPPPPEVAYKPAGLNGLRLFACTPGQYQRENIRTVTPAYSPFAAVSDVEYALTIGDWPATNFDGFQAQIFLQPASPTIPATDSAPDWGQANTIWIQIQGYRGGGAGARFMYKTNQPAGNLMFWNTDPTQPYGVGNMGYVWSPDPRGTWKVRVNASDYSITMTAPNGSVTNFAMPTESMALFVNPLYAYFGIDPNSLDNLGQSALFTHITITGDPFDVTPIDETFSAPALDPAIWEYAAEDKSGILLVSDASAGWLSWTLPDLGFHAQVSPTVDAGWVAPEPALPTPFLNNGVKTILVPKDGLPQPNCFFRLLKE